MKRRRRKAVCEHCGRTYTVCRYNQHRQRYCRDARCVGERRRQRQRQRYKMRYRCDEAFRTAEQQRARAGVARRRRRVPPAVASAPATAAWSGLPALLTGLVAQLLGSDDPGEVCESVRAFAARGQRLAVAGGWTG